MARYLPSEAGIETRELPGGTGPKAVAGALEEAGARLAALRMNKSYRQGQILKLIRSSRLHTQEDLAKALRGIGVPATQVTLSRDIRELGLVKTADGYTQGAPEAASNGPAVEALVAEFVEDIRIAQNLLVLRTPPGHANVGRGGAR